MEDLTAIQKLDYVLEYIKKQDLNILDPMGIIQIGDLSIERTELERILAKLNDDKYIENRGESYNIVCIITFDGHLFQGYQRQSINDEENESRIRRRENSLIYATWLAGFGATGVLIWEILKWSYHHIPFFHYLKFWQ